MSSGINSGLQAKRLLLLPIEPILPAQFFPHSLQVFLVESVEEMTETLNKKELTDHEVTGIVCRIKFLVFKGAH